MAVLPVLAACAQRDDIAEVRRQVAEAEATVKHVAEAVAIDTARQITEPCPGASETREESPVADPPGAPSRATYPFVAVHGDHAAFYLKWAPGPEDGCMSFWRAERMVFPDGTHPQKNSLVSCGVDHAAVGYGLPIYRRRAR